MRLFPGSLQSGILSKSACYLHLSEDGSIPIINAMSMIDLGPNNGGEGDYTNRASWIRIAVLGHKSVGKTGSSGVSFIIASLALDVLCLCGSLILGIIICNYLTF